MSYSTTKEYKREYYRRWRKANPEKVKTIKRRWAEKHGFHNYAETVKAWRKANPEKVRQYQERRRARQMSDTYGLSIEEYNILWAGQDGCCASCGKHESEQAKRLHVDHDHATTRIRGLLCSNCNTGIGLLGDSVDGLRAALAYLETQT